MTQTRRIILNVVATYGRSLYALGIGLFTARWVLMTLGEVDYGLFGVVGGLTGFIAFLNNLMAESIARFYAFSVGQSMAKENGFDALNDCRRWFNVAVAIHTIIPLVLLTVGYPIGEWAVRHYLTIPPDRMQACIWVFRISCLTCFVSMTTVPYNAMYYAHQEIAELTIYGFASTTLNFGFLCYMVSHVRDWLVPYAAWTSALSVGPALIISARSFFKFKECRYRFSYCLDLPRYRQLLVYAGSRFLVSFAFLINNNGISILVNKVLGPARNAAMTIGNSVSSHCMTLSQSLTTAFSPAITNAAGAGDLMLMRTLALRACKFGAVAILAFAMPLSLEIDEVMRLWLKQPPAQVSALCVCLLGVAVCDKLSDGLWMSVFAIGKIAKFNICESLVWFTVFPLSYMFISFGFGLLGVGFAFLTAKFLAIGVKLYFGSRIAGISACQWLRDVLLPLVVANVVAGSAAILSVATAEPSFWRVVRTSCLFELVFLPLVLFVVCKETERRLVRETISKFIARW